MKLDPQLLHGLEWRMIGPHRGGRVVAVTGDPHDAMTFYFGACAGGVWKTTDGGTTWDCISDGFFNTAAIGAIQIAPSDSNVLYVGTGETCIRGNVSHGDGVYKSTDAGKTWANIGLRETRHIAKIRVHPEDPDWVYVAALGHAWGPHEERGVFRSRDGGKTWEKILYRDEKTGAIDLALDPTNPRILYAALWQAQRYPYKMISGGEGSGIFKSTDGGDTWTEISNNPGLPTGVKGKIGLAVSPAKPERVWALVEAKDGALFRSDDGGATFERLSAQSDLRRRAWYYMHIYADPLDAETVWVLNTECWKSIDGGKTFFSVPSPHGDHHDQWIDPREARRMIRGDDGGAYISFNGGESWSSLFNQPTAQFYHVTTDDRQPYRVYGSQQDNSAISLPALSSRGAINPQEWFEPGGGESGYIAIKPDDPDIVVGGAVGSGWGHGRLIHFDRRTDQERNITIWPEVMGMGVGSQEHKYRFQWTFPILFSRYDPNVLYVAGNVLFKSTDEGASWQVVSPDLSRKDQSKMELSGGPITSDNTGVEIYGTIFALAESPHQKDLLWAGTDDGLVHLSRDGGKTWTNITPRDLPEWSLISIIEPSSHDAASAYLAATRYKHDDTRPYLYKTNDYGKTWQLITNGIPENDFTRVIRADSTRRGLLYAGTETGVYVSFDDGENWQPLQLNLPHVPIHDLHLKQNDLIAATHGRSFWILDDVTPLHQLSDTTLHAPVTLLAPRPTVRWRINKGYGNKPMKGILYRWAGTLNVGYRLIEKPTGEKVERFVNAGQNPPEGVLVHYTFKEKPQGEVTLTFKDAQGNVAKQFSSVKPEKKEGAEEKKEPRVSAEAGLNRCGWNLRYEDATKLPGDKATEELLAGPVAAPGNYRVELSVDGNTQTQDFEILPDPRIRASANDLRDQFDLLLQIRDKLAETHKTVLQIRDLKTQADAWAKRARGHAREKEIADAAQAVQAALTAVEQELWQPDSDSALVPPSKLNSRLAALAEITAAADYAPTQPQREAFADLAARIDAQIARLRDVIAKDVAAFNQLVREAGLEPVAVT